MYYGGYMYIPIPIPIPNWKSRGFPIPIPIPSQCGDSLSKRGLVRAIPTGTGLFAISSSICHSLGPGCTQPKGTRIYPAITLIRPSVLCWKKCEKQVPQWLSHNECASYLDRGDPDHFCLIGPGCTRPYTNILKWDWPRNRNIKCKNVNRIKLNSEIDPNCNYY